MENNDERLLISFLNEASIEVEDNHFSNRVMRRLPAKKQKTGWIVPAFTMLGVILAILLIDVKATAMYFLDILAGVPLFYLLGGIALFPFVFLLFYSLANRNREVHGF